MDKKKYQIFTPAKTAEHMLDMAGYIEQNDLWQRKFLDNSCGDGALLCTAFKRYAASAKRLGFSPSQISRQAALDFCGFENDEDIRKRCLLNLETLTRQEGIPAIAWDIRGKDFLQQDYQEKWDYIVGNPPYISFSDQSAEIREALRKKFESCKKGRFDYFYAFIEAGLSSLSQTGILVYLVPASVFKNRHAQALRALLRPYITTVEDYTGKSLFDTVTTSSVIFTFDRTKTQSDILYKSILEEKSYKVPKKTLQTEKWVFEPQPEEIKTKVSDAFRVLNTVATQCNEVFILCNAVCEGASCRFTYNGKEYNIEQAAVRLADSPRVRHQHKTEYIIFPYYYDDQHRLCHYSEKAFIKKFPRTYAYLQEQREKLNKRKSDKTASWFEYGRSQALKALDAPKLMISSVVTNEILLYELGQEVIPTAGLFIVSKGDKTLEEAKKILNSSNFLAYLKKRGVPSNGCSVRITSQDIADYPCTWA